MSPAPSPLDPSPAGPPCPQTPPAPRPPLDPRGGQHDVWKTRRTRKNRRHCRQGTSHCSCLEHCFLFAEATTPDVCAWRTRLRRTVCTMCSWTQSRTRRRLRSRGTSSRDSSSRSEVTGNTPSGGHTSGQRDGEFLLWRFFSKSRDFPTT